MILRRPWTEGPLGLGFLLTIDFLAVFDAFALGYLVRFHWKLLGDSSTLAPDPAEYLKAWVLGVAMVLTLFHAYGLYHGRKRDALANLTALIRAGAVAMVFIVALGYFYRGFSYSRLSVISTCLFGVALSGGFRIAWEGYCRQLRVTGKAVIPAILIGSKDIPRFLAKRVAEDSGLGLKIVAVADEHPIGDDDDFVGLARGTLQDLPELIASTGASEVLIGHPAIQHHQLLELIQCCEQRGVRIRMVPATYDLLIDVRDFEDVGGIPFVTVNERRSRPLFRGAKRALDIVMSSVLLLLLTPVFVAIAVATRVDSGCPILFRQTRVGRDGQPFSMLKFRTMVVDAEERLADLVDLDKLDEPVFKLENDPRVTRVGRWLRRLSLDELPQLVNVLRGEMSIVGPRPEEARVVDRYDVWEKRRLKLKPGITGLQQIHCRGSKSLKERVRWDILYLRRESLLLDAWILFRTVGVVLRGRGAR